jgi:hypothetical protein
VANFDARRALLMRGDIFAPFRVTSTRPLGDALAAGDVQQKTPVLVAEFDAATVVLLRRQLTYHHVAQGDVGGEQWMVSY